MITEGANHVGNCWGPVLGAKVLKYRTAVILGLVCQTVGVLAFGPENYTVYGGFLGDWTRLKAYPELTLYALMWIDITPVVWQSLAIWHRILVPAYLGTGDCSNHLPVLPCIATNCCRAGDTEGPVHHFLQQHEGL